MNRDQMMDWLLRRQRRCPCGRTHLLTDVHHVFFRRVKKDMTELYHPANVVAANNACHLAAGHDFQLASALICFIHVGGPDQVLEWADTLPLKIKHLPSHFWEAQERWRLGERF
jgi:hypothetical protein